jgi:AmmeMemoRadiSam system protein A
MDFRLTDEEKTILLKLARETIFSWITDRKKPSLPEASGNLASKSGAFVTLHSGGMLRGCIGNMVSENPIVETIQEMAIAAAVKDPRFPPVGIDELEKIDIEISVLSPLERIGSIEDIEVGKHGIMLTNRWSRGVLLPQVATEQRWDRDTFIEHTCLKAGLSEDAWKDPETIIEIFSAEVFGE